MLDVVYLQKVILYLNIGLRHIIKKPKNLLTVKKTMKTKKTRSIRNKKKKRVKK